MAPATSLSSNCLLLGHKNNFRRVVRAEQHNSDYEGICVEPPPQVFNSTVGADALAVLQAETKK